MASILDRYGIKEVADVTFYKIDDNGVPMYPVLYLDTLKVSTIEQTAETADARGGKGNPKLITWDYGKEINVTLEDALFSPKSMAIMFGNGTVAAIPTTSSGTDVPVGGAQLIMKTEVFTTTGSDGDTFTSSDLEDNKHGWKTSFVGPDGKQYTKLNPKFYEADEDALKRTEDALDISSFKGGTKYFCTYDLAAKGHVIEISQNTFPGTYYVTGDTYARSDASGEDQFFQFIIPKAKVTSENTITLEAEGDPSVFNMNLTVLRPSDGGAMMKLVQYDLEGSTGTEEEVSHWYHNHDVDGHDTDEEG